MLKYWDQVRSSFWFIPSLMVIAAAVLAAIAVWSDDVAAGGAITVPRFAWVGSPEGATAVLGTIAGSMITIAGVVFSLTLVALSLASSQFGPRLLRNFMRDSTNQFVLGTFVATFLYSLLVMRAIQPGAEGDFVPHISVNISVVLALASIGVLIYFIHHISLSIQADEIIARVALELEQGIDRLFPDELGEDVPRVDEGASRSESWFDDAATIRAVDEGYLQIVDADTLLELAKSSSTILRLECRPGDYIVAGTPIVFVAPSSAVRDELIDAIRAALVVGNQRSTAQDVEFAAQQLVEIAVRALSPGINDPFTAMTCIDRLGSGFCRLACRKIPSSTRLDDAGEPRIVAPVVTFERMVAPALSMIRQSARADVAVTLRLLDAIRVVGSCVRRDADREVLVRHANLVHDCASESLTVRDDNEAVDRRYARTMETLQRQASRTAPVF